MFTNLCLEHLTANSPDARAHVNAGTAPTMGISVMWDFVTKPYARQRPSGAPPG